MGQENKTEPDKPTDTNKPVIVIVKDVDFEFSSMVTLMVKAAFASIPALLVVGTFLLIAALVIGLGYGLLSRIIGK